MSLVFAIAAALLLGGSDFCAARAALNHPAVTITRTAVALSVVVAPVLLLVVDSQFILRDLLLGAAGGVCIITGLMLGYRGYAVARIGVVAPMSSVLLGVVPVAWDLIRGDRPGALAATGIAIGIVALGLTSYTPDGDGSIRLGALLGVASGVAFGTGFAIMGAVSDESGLAPLVAQRIAGFTLLAIIWRFQSSPFFAAHPIGRRYALGTGAFGVAAMASLQLGFRDGASGTVSVAASQYATVAVLLSVALNRERMRWWQALGVGATAVGVALMALGS